MSGCALLLCPRLHPLPAGTAPFNRSGARIVYLDLPSCRTWTSLSALRSGQFSTPLSMVTKGGGERHFTILSLLIEVVFYFLVASFLGFVAPSLPVHICNATSGGSSLAPCAASQKDACTNSSSELHGWHRTVHKGHGSTSRSCPCWPSLGQHLGGTRPFHPPRQHDGRTSELVVLALPPVQQVKCPILSHLWEEVDSELRCRGPDLERMVREYGDFSGPVASSQGSLTCSISPSFEAETAVQAAKFPGQRQGQGTAARQGQDEGQGSLQRQGKGSCQSQRARCLGHAAGDTLAATCHAHPAESGNRFEPAGHQEHPCPDRPTWSGQRSNHSAPAGQISTGEILGQLHRGIAAGPRERGSTARGTHEQVPRVGKPCHREGQGSAKCYRSPLQGGSGFGSCHRRARGHAGSGGRTCRRHGTAPTSPEKVEDDPGGPLQTDASSRNRDTQEANQTRAGSRPVGRSPGRRIDGSSIRSSFGPHRSFLAFLFAAPQLGCTTYSFRGPTWSPVDGIGQWEQPDPRVPTRASMPDHVTETCLSYAHSVTALADYKSPYVATLLASLWHLFVDYQDSLLAPGPDPFPAAFSEEWHRLVDALVWRLSLMMDSLSWTASLP